jgi:hypothetical protein
MAAVVFKYQLEVIMLNSHTLKPPFSTALFLFVLLFFPFQAVGSSQKGSENAGFIPFVSFGENCAFQVIDSEIIDGVMYATFHNDNIETSKEELVAGPMIGTPTLAIDLATGAILDIEINVQHFPWAVDGTWETTATVEDVLILGDRLIKATLSGYGTGELAGLGIRYQVVVNAKAGAAPPHIMCEGNSPYLATGKIFPLDF